MSARFCGQCGAQVSEGKAFCETCGNAIAASPPAPASQSTAIPKDTAAPKDASVDGTTSLQIFRHRLSNSMILGGIGILLLIVSFFLPYSRWDLLGLIEATTSPFDLLVSNISGGNIVVLAVVGPLIIGIVCGIIGLSRSSWILTLLSGVVSFITTALVPLGVETFELQIVWVVVSVLGGVLLIVSGLMMRQGRSSPAIS